MRLVIDMQGAQTSSSRNRGIGRYTLSLIREMVKLRQNDEVLLVLNGYFEDTIQVLKEFFASLLPPENIHVWMPPRQCNGLDKANTWRRESAEIIRECFVAALQPDMIFFTSLFEGLSDDAVTSVNRFTCTIPTAVILYDLIPLIHQKIYLENKVICQWYFNKLDSLRRADLLLAISDSSAQEAIKYLGSPGDMVVNISTACDEHFYPQTYDVQNIASLRSRYGLIRPFVMYTGGIDHRKNIEGLIRAFALLPQSVRKRYQLAVVCSAHDVDKKRLLQLAQESGLQEDDLIMTGFVPEEDLLALYNLCELFVFPSWHEGFGLPALEAMACGRPVIGSNVSSIPEVIGNEAALFDPRNDASISAKMLQALIDDTFRNTLAERGVERAKIFSWELSAARAWQAIRKTAIMQSADCNDIAPCPVQRPRLAYISPVPAARSGIADYSVELLPELSRFYSIDIIAEQQEEITDPWLLANCQIRSVDWFEQNHQRFDRILYQMGNSHYHTHMLKLIENAPGVIVLHDFFLSGMFSFRDSQHRTTDFPKALQFSHGWSSVSKRFTKPDPTPVIYEYPCNKQVLQSNYGVIVHSESSKRLAEQWYGPNWRGDWYLIPHLRIPVYDSERAAARKTLGLSDNAFVVCSFGLLGATKLNHSLLDSWQTSLLNSDDNCRLVFVGENDGGDYGRSLLQTIRGSGCRAEITGWVDIEAYRLWLTAADVAVQLRTLSRGETSGTVLDCMNYALPTIVNAHGSLTDIPSDLVVKLQDEFTVQELSDALNQLWQDPSNRTKLGERARQHILNQHNHRQCALLYRQAIEKSYAKAATGLPGLCDQLADIAPDFSEDDRQNIAEVVAENFPVKLFRPRLLLDVSALWTGASFDAAALEREKTILKELLLSASPIQPVELVSANMEDGTYRYARKFACQILGVPQHWAEDEVLETWPGDILFSIGCDAAVLKTMTPDIIRLRTRGVSIWLYLPKTLVDELTANQGPELVQRFEWFSQLSVYQGVLLSDVTHLKQIQPWLDIYTPDASLRVLALENSPGVSIDNLAKNWMDALKREDSLLSLKPDKAVHYWGASYKFSTQVGERSGTNIRTTGKSGFLLFGPYISLPSGQYSVCVYGNVTCLNESESYIDVAVGKGTRVLAKTAISKGKEGGLCRADFELSVPCTDLEIRICVGSDDVFEVEKVSILFISHNGCQLK